MTSSTEPAVSLRSARQSEAPTLSALAMRSKAVWGYPPEFLAACRAELTVTPAAIASALLQHVVAVNPGVLGFYALSQRCATDFELDALFVEPERIQTGIGRRLLQHALTAARARGGQRLLIEADPHAVRFYRAAGGVHVGSAPSASIPGRVLPIFAIDLSRLDAAPAATRG